MYIKRQSRQSGKVAVGGPPKGTPNPSCRGSSADGADRGHPGRSRGTEVPVLRVADLVGLLAQVVSHGGDEVRRLGHPATEDREPEDEGDDECEQRCRGERPLECAVGGVAGEREDGGKDAGREATRPPVALHGLVLADVDVREQHGRYQERYGYRRCSWHHRSDERGHDRRCYQEQQQHDHQGANPDDSPPCRAFLRYEHRIVDTLSFLNHGKLLGCSLKPIKLHRTPKQLKLKNSAYTKYIYIYYKYLSNIQNRGVNKVF